jgi:hypothetical protein
MSMLASRSVRALASLLVTLLALPWMALQWTVLHSMELPWTAPLSLAFEWLLERQSPMWDQRSLALQWLVLQWLALQWLAMQWLAMQWLAMQWLVLQWLAMQWLVLQWLALQWLVRRLARLEPQSEPTSVLRQALPWWKQSVLNLRSHKHSR